MGGAGTILGKIIGPTAAAGEAATTAGGAAAGFAGALEAATPLLAGLGVAAAAAAPLIIATAVAIERGNEASANWNTTLDANARFLTNVVHKIPVTPQMAMQTVNGEPGLVLSFAGQAFVAMALEIDDGRIQAVRMVVNPDKLGHVTASVT